MDNRSTKSGTRDRKQLGTNDDGGERLKRKKENIWGSQGFTSHVRKKCTAGGGGSRREKW